MGVTLDLRLIDHERIVVRGLPAVNDAICHNDPERLREYLKGLPIDVDPAVVEYRQTRLAKLREFAAPEIIIQNEERFLRWANGEAYQPMEYQNSTLNELRHLLGTWCWVTHSYSLDKAWDELHWLPWAIRSFARSDPKSATARVIIHRKPVMSFSRPCKQWTCTSGKSTFPSGTSYTGGQYREWTTRKSPALWTMNWRTRATRFQCSSPPTQRLSKRDGA